MRISKMGCRCALAHVLSTCQQAAGGVVVVRSEHLAQSELPHPGGSQDSAEGPPAGQTVGTPVRCTGLRLTLRGQQLQLSGKEEIRVEGASGSMLSPTPPRLGTFLANLGPFQGLRVMTSSFSFPSLLLEHSGDELGARRKSIPRTQVWHGWARSRDGPGISVQGRRQLP